jgi:hypothetical protein
LPLQTDKQDSQGSDFVAPSSTWKAEKANLSAPDSSTFSRQRSRLIESLSIILPASNLSPEADMVNTTPGASDSDESLSASVPVTEQVISTYNASTGTELCGCFALIVVLVLLRNLMGGVWNVGEGQAVWLGHYVCDVSVWCASEEGVRMKVGMYRVGNVCSLRNDGYLVLLQDIIED